MKYNRIYKLCVCLVIAASSQTVRPENDIDQQEQPTVLINTQQRDTNTTATTVIITNASEINDQTLDQLEITPTGDDEPFDIINVEDLAGYKKKPTLSEIIKWTYAYACLRASMAIDSIDSAWDTISTHAAKGKNSALEHVKRNKKTYIISAACLGTTIVVVWYYNHHRPSA